MKKLTIELSERLLDQNIHNGYAVQIQVTPDYWFFATDACNQMVVCPTKESAELFLRELINPPDIHRKDLKIVAVEVTIK